MNNHQRKCRKCLNKVDKQEVIRTRDGYYCETCHKVNKRNSMLIIGGIFAILLLLLAIYIVVVIRQKEENNDE